jgi:hypothetical protein
MSPNLFLLMLQGLGHATHPAAHAAGPATTESSLKGDRSQDTFDGALYMVTR